MLGCNIYVTADIPEAMKADLERFQKQQQLQTPPPSTKQFSSPAPQGQQQPQQQQQPGPSGSIKETIDKASKGAPCLLALLVCVVC